MLDNMACPKGFTCYFCVFDIILHHSHLSGLLVFTEIIAFLHNVEIFVLCVAGVPAVGSLLI